MDVKNLRMRFLKSPAPARGYHVFSPRLKMGKVKRVDKARDRMRLRLNEMIDDGVRERVRWGETVREK